jgi:hypothetical protein
MAEAMKTLARAKLSKLFVVYTRDVIAAFYEL